MEYGNTPTPSMASTISTAHEHTMDSATWDDLWRQRKELLERKQIEGTMEPAGPELTDRGMMQRETGKSRENMN